MVLPRPPIKAATLLPTANSPLGHDFTMPTHSMPLTGCRFCPFSAAHVHLGVIDSKCLDMNNDFAWFRLWFRNLLDDQTIQTSEVIEYDGAHTISPFESVSCFRKASLWRLQG